jgi:hypothetical protein
MKTDPIITKAKFRLMLISSLLFAILSSVLDAYNDTSIAINEALAIDPQIWELVIISILAPAFFILFIGLFLFKEWARKLYVYSFFPILLTPLLPSLSWTFVSGLSAIFVDLSGILSTLILGILIVPSLYKPLFQKNIK